MNTYIGPGDDDGDEDDEEVSRVLRVPALLQRDDETNVQFIERGCQAAIEATLRSGNKVRYDA
jgi:hypothetical protein